MKTKISQYENNSNFPDTVLEQKSLEIVDEARATQAELEKNYSEMARQIELNGSAPEYFREFLHRRESSLKNTAANLRKTYIDVLFMSNELSGRMNDIKRSEKKRKLISAAPSNTVIDYSENQLNNFARGINMYKIILICFVGSFVGVLIEMLWCLVRNGYIEGRAGLVYGPFNLLYGFGAVALTVALYRFRNRKGWILFLGGFTIGSLVEYICSLVQELVIGSRSWDYTGMPFNINGRICLMYSIFWGFLGVLWIKNIYPRMSKMILHIPNKAGKIATWIIVVFLSFDALVSAGAVFRWSQRVNGVPSSGCISSFFDRHFPDERMERVYANMEF